MIEGTLPQVKLPLDHLGLFCGSVMKGTGDFVEVTWNTTTAHDSWCFVVLGILWLVSTMMGTGDFVEVTWSRACLWLIPAMMGTGDFVEVTWSWVAFLKFAICEELRFLSPPHDRSCYHQHHSLCGGMKTAENIVELQHQQLAALDDNIRRDGPMFRRQRTVSDGHCLYRAIGAATVRTGNRCMLRSCKHSLIMPVTASLRAGTIHRVAKKRLPDF